MKNKTIVLFFMDSSITASRGGAAYFCGEPGHPDCGDPRSRGGCSAGKRTVPRAKTARGDLAPAGRKGRISASLALDKAGL